MAAGLGQGSNPCAVLSSFHSGAVYDLVEVSGPGHLPNYVFSVNILGKEYRGTGSSKKEAKKAAAAAALRDAYKINLCLSLEHSSPSAGVEGTVNNAKEEPYCPG